MGKDPNVVFEWYLAQRVVDQGNVVHAVDMARATLDFRLFELVISI